MNNDLVALRLQLLSKGWHITPARMKECHVFGWNGPAWLAKELSEDKVKSWSTPHRFPRDLSTGLRVEGGLVVVDIDVNDALANRLLDEIQRFAPAFIAAAPMRSGASPYKVALFGRLKQGPDEIPFARWASARFLRPNETKSHSNKGHLVEVFGGKPTGEGRCSKHFTIYGPHSEGVEYSWDEAAPDLAQCSLAELPELDHLTIGKIIDAYERLAREAGWAEIEPARLTSDNDIVYDLTDEMVFEIQDGDRVSYAALQKNMRCSSSFFDPHSGGNRSKCHVFETPRHEGSIAIYDYKTLTLHYHVRYTPVDVIDFSEKLREKIKADAAQKAYKPQDPPPQGKPDVITATPYVWVDPSLIPPRQFLYGRRLARQFVSATVAPGGVGKTALEISEALAMASGKPLLGVNVDPCRVWLWSLEDPRDETVRRVQATAKHYRLTAADLGDRLLVDTAREQRLVVARKLRETTEIAQPVVEALVRQILAHQVDVLVIDPFISCHDVPENDNSAIDTVTKLWAEVANLGNCAVELVHHVRKGEKEVTVESARGGAAFSDACRMVRVVNRMDKELGDKLDISNHRLFFRTYIDKNNLAPPAEVSDWFTLVSVDLGNGGKGHGGDRIGVVAAWEYPTTPDNAISQDDFSKVATAIAAEHWRSDPRAARWVGIPIARVLGLDPDMPGHRARIQTLIKYWVNKKLLVEVERDDDTRRKRTFVEVSLLAQVSVP